MINHVCNFDTYGFLFYILKQLHQSYVNSVLPFIHQKILETKIQIICHILTVLLANVVHHFANKIKMRCYRVCTFLISSWDTSIAPRDPFHSFINADILLWLLLLLTSIYPIYIANILNFELKFFDPLSYPKLTKFSLSLSLSS